MLAKMISTGVYNTFGGILIYIISLQTGVFRKIFGANLLLVES